MDGEQPTIEQTITQQTEPVATEPPRERAPNFLIQKIIEAVKSTDLEELISAVELINAYLTSHSKLGDPNQIRGQSADLKKFLDSYLGSEKKFAHAYIYLGDGGTSRLVIDVIHGDIIVDISNTSSDEVKEKWLRLQ